MTKGKSKEELLNEIRQAWVEKGYPTLSETKSDEEVSRLALERYLRWIREEW